MTRICEFLWMIHISIKHGVKILLCLLSQFGPDQSQEHATPRIHLTIPELALLLRTDAEDEKCKNATSKLGYLAHSLSAFTRRVIFRSNGNICIRHYSLQNAEIGHAVHYWKRKHVLRIRAEGEQFLLQVSNDRSVRQWIDAFQSGANTSKNLDTREEPRFTTLPIARSRNRIPIADVTRGGIDLTLLTIQTNRG